MRFSQPSSGIFILALSLSLAVNVFARAEMSLRPAGEPLVDGLVLQGGRCLLLGDYDADGVEDLISAYATADGRGALLLHRGNLQTRFPHHPSTDAVSDPLPFQAASLAAVLPAPPDWLLTGDFDADGHADVIAAKRGEASFVFLAGAGTGRLGPAAVTELDGRLTALASGEIHRVDGRFRYT